MSVHPTKLPRLHSVYTDVLFELLKGEPLLDANDRAVLGEDGRPIYLRPKAAILKEIREFLKDNGIDSEPLEGSPVDSVAKKLTHFDGEPLYLEESGETQNLPESDLP